MQLLLSLRLLAVTFSTKTRSRHLIHCPLNMRPPQCFDSSDEFCPPFVEIASSTVPSRRGVCSRCQSDCRPVFLPCWPPMSHQMLTKYRCPASFPDSVVFGIGCEWVWLCPHLLEAVLSQFQMRIQLPRSCSTNESSNGWRNDCGEIGSWRSTSCYVSVACIDCMSDFRWVVHRQHHRMNRRWVCACDHRSFE